MNVDLGIWQKLIQAALFLFFIAFLILIGVWYLPLIRINERYRRHILDLEGQVQKAQAEGRQLKLSEEAMRDPKTIERLARERLGYAKTGETVIRFEAPVITTWSNPPARP